MKYDLLILEFIHAHVDQAPSRWERWKKEKKKNVQKMNSEMHISRYDMKLDQDPASMNFLFPHLVILQWVEQLKSIIIFSLSRHFRPDYDKYPLWPAMK